MRSTRALLVGAIFGVVTFIAPPANAGGGRWDINGHIEGRAVVTVGEIVEISETVWLGEDGRGEPNGGYHAGPEHGPFYFYIVSLGNREYPYPPPLPPDSVYVADVEFGPIEDSSVSVGGSFTMPSVEPGEYVLLHCNDPCSRQLGDLMSTSFTAVADASEARLTRTIDKIDERVFNQGYWVRTKFRILKRNLSSELGKLRGETAAIDHRLTAIEVRLAALEERHPVSMTRAGFLEGGLAAGAVIALLVAFHLLSTRARRR